MHLGFRMNIGPRGSYWKLMMNSKIIFTDSCHGSWLILHKIEPIAFEQALTEKTATLKRAFN